ncbi:MAG TPA: hypothetical protein PKD85_16160, partial [Saprospiraceae bacterium]|nr:hypothetical protein [Saprospiraceae bacterium]
NIDAIVPNDGKDGKWFKIEFTYPDGITAQSVAPSISDSIDFSIAKTFSIAFTDKETRKYTVNIIEQAPEEPVITAITVSGAQQTVINEGARRIEIRVPQGTNLTSITPTFTLTPVTAVLVGGPRAFDFTNSQTVTVKNGASTKVYTIKIQDYGFTKVTTLLNGTLANSARPGFFLDKPESSISLSQDGRFAFVAFEGGIKRYDLNAPSTAPIDVDLKNSNGGNAPTRVLQTVGTYLLSGNAIWESGEVILSAWNLDSPATPPVEVVRIPVTPGSIIQNFQAKLEGNNIIAYFSDRGPLRKSPRLDPIMYTVNIPIANIALGTKVTAFTSSRTITGLVNAGIADGPNGEIVPIPNSQEFFFNHGTIAPTHLTSSFSNPVFFSGALVNTSSVGLKAFEFNRGKYAMWGVFSWSTNAANPNANRLVVVDLTKKGFRQSIIDINDELANGKFTTWNDIQKVSFGLGGNMSDPGGFYAQTAFATTSNNKLRIACISAQNGFVVLEVE